jgi:hypothetical protein
MTNTQFIVGVAICLLIGALWAYWRRSPRG